MSISGNGAAAITITGAVTGSGAANQVTLWSGANTLTGNPGFTWSGSGATMDVVIGRNLTVGGLTSGAVTLSSTAGLQKTDAGLTWTGTAGSFVLSSAYKVDVATAGAYTYNAVNVITAQTALSNFYFGNSGSLSASGADNVAVGALAMSSLTSGTGNVATGYRAALHLTTGQYNTGVGFDALVERTTGSSNVGLGGAAGSNGTTGSDNTAVGFFALHDATTASRNVGLGAYAGANETGSDKLFVDNQSRGSEAVGRTNSLIYGIFNATVASQRLVVNAGGFRVSALPTYANNAAAVTGGLIAGDFYIVTASDPAQVAVVV